MKKAKSFPFFYFRMCETIGTLQMCSVAVKIRKVFTLRHISGAYAEIDVRAYTASNTLNRYPVVTTLGL